MSRHSARLPRLLAALSLPLAAGACSDHKPPSVEHAVQPVQAVRVNVRPAEEYRTVTGTIRARREAQIGFRAAGRIGTRDVDLGDRVKAGQVLARLDPADLALAVQSAEADLASALAQAAQAHSDAGRSTILRAQGWAAASTDETKQAADRSAAERVAAARAALQLARNRQDYGTLRAGVDCVVTAVLADPGIVVAEGQPVLRLAEAGAMEAEVALPEVAAAQDAGAKATVTAWARPDVAMAPTLRQMSPAADPKLRTYTARFAIADPPPWLAYGMSVTVRLAYGGGEDLAIVLLAALADRDGRPIVWVIGEAGGTPEARPVGLRRLGTDHALVSGLFVVLVDPGDQGVSAFGLGTRASVAVQGRRPQGDRSVRRVRALAEFHVRLVHHPEDAHHRHQDPVRLSDRDQATLIIRRCPGIIASGFVLVGKWYSSSRDGTRRP